jgi:hypothetical protein
VKIVKTVAPVSPPVTIEFTAEEAELLRVIVGYNSTVADSVKGRAGLVYDEVNEFLRKLYHTLTQG